MYLCGQFLKGVPKQNATRIWRAGGVNGEAMRKLSSTAESIIRA